jgi:PAS domain S-box-containing protein
MRTRSRHFGSLDLLLQATLDAVVVLGSDRNIVEWNERAVELLGWQREETLGRNIAELAIPARHRATLDRELQLLRNNSVEDVIARRVEISAFRKAGEEFPIEVSISVLPDKKSTLFALCMRDISARASARDSVRQFKILVEGVRDYAIFMLDPEGRISTWNSGAEHIKGYSAEDVIGEHFSLVYTEEDKREGVPTRALQQAAKDGRYEAEGWRLRKDGSRFRATVVIDAIRDDAGTLVGFAKVTRDITERHLAHQMLEQSRERLLQSQKNGSDWSTYRRGRA